ncbi:glycosyltransferase [Haladaptatus sp. CMAA 1911]|uniref:glycosyltransferase n=1 Tax=unclassified Haladaptatus TaxID=2622732 RepID=UPI003754F2CC
MKVLLYVFSGKGGTAQYPTQMANGISKWADTHIIGPADADIEGLLSNRVTFHSYSATTNTTGRITGRILGLGELLWLTRDIDPDVIHHPFISSASSTILVPILKLFKVPVVGTVHDPIAHTGMEYGPQHLQIRTRLNKWTSEMLDTTIVHGQACYEQAVEAKYPMEKVEIFPHGLYDFFLEEEFEDIPTDSNTLLFFGRIRPNKGYDRIPEILNIVEREFQNISAIVAGNPDVGAFRNSTYLDDTLEKLRDDSRVELHDRYIPNEEVGKFFSRATAVVLPYYDATASGVLKTAYAFGTPVIATNTGDIGRTVSADGTGLVTDRNTSREIGNKTIEMLRNDEQQKEFSDQICECQKRYDWERIGKDIVELYEEL